MMPAVEAPREAQLKEMTDFCRIWPMQTTLRIDDTTYREAKAEAARLGLTLTRFIEEALRQRIASSRPGAAARQRQIEERDRLMESLLRRTARFRVGRKPTREEMNER
jgi:antitoxin component of RelBE/YafQ-DinJ toxin-antitoxin module